MAISELIEVRETQQWPQGDVRDPLGTWGARLAVTGDGSGGSVKVGFFVPAARRSAFVYTCYDVNLSKISGTVTTESAKTRLLANYPNIDPQAGIQGYNYLFFSSWSAPLAITAPIGGYATSHPLSPQSRFLLLYDPTPNNSAMVIVELENNDNIDLAVWSFEAMGYYWDRSVMHAPGGPRHPGSS